MRLPSTISHTLSSMISTPRMRKKYQATMRKGSVYLSQQDTERIGTLFDEIYHRLHNDLGERDRNYIYRTIKIQKSLEVASRTLLFFAKKNLLCNGIGAFGLGISKIIENMEIGHNVMHGQYDWMNDPALSSKTYEWDNVCPSAQWKRTHNNDHHVNTNITELDRDLGYGAMRVSRDQPWRIKFLANISSCFLLFLFFEYPVMVYELELDEFWKNMFGKVKKWDKVDRQNKWNTIKPLIIEEMRKLIPQIIKDYVFFPLLRPRYFLWNFGSNFLANIIRNMWTHAAIFCGHFPSEVLTFSIEETRHETRGEWYVRQLLGSCNIYGSKLFHFMTGNLSYQIEHHLFPQIPAHRLADISQEVRHICEEYHLPYNCGPFLRQISNVWWNIAKHSLPNEYFKPIQKFEVHIERAYNLHASLLPQKLETAS